jgi:DNA-binding transcriptional LysR family regulator
MQELKPLAVFAEVVESGSMSAAARRLGISPSAVSQIVRTLEARSGVTLLHRSTRKLALTEAGERYYPHCKRLVEAARAAAESLQLARDAPSGELRVSAPVGFAIHIAPALAPLLAEAPQLRLRLLVDDAMIDLIDARIDLAVRVGRLADSSWVARRLCDFEIILCGSPDYLARHGTPTTPEHLPAHQWLGFARESASAFFASPPASLLLDMQSMDGARHRITVEARVASNNQVSLQQMCEHGLGLARFVHSDVRSALEQGTLTRVLPECRFAPLPVWVVTPNLEAAEAAKVRAAASHLRRYFAGFAPAPIGASASSLQRSPSQVS